MSDDGAASSPSRRFSAEVALTAVLAFAAIGVPLLVSQTGRDVFRIPKESLFEAAAFFGAALLGIVALYRGGEPFRRLWRERRAALLVTIAAVVWTAIATAASTNRELSALSLLWVTSCAIVFLATLVASERYERVLALVPIAPAIVNAIIAMLQRSGTWNPLQFDANISLHFRTAGLIGTPNELGVYLLVPAIIAAAMATTNGGRVRGAWLAALIVLLAGIVASESLSALVAIAAAGTTLLLLSVKRAKRAFAILAVAALVVGVAYSPFRARAAQMLRDARAGRYVEVTSYRLPAQLVAARMFATHPLTGVGPGCFGFWYMPYKAQMNLDYPEFFALSENFGEAHNDHLQTLAVSGLPGYAIFIAAMFILGRESLRQRRAGNRSLAASGALPLVVGFAVVAIAQFPLSLAAVMGVTLNYAALMISGADS